MTRTLRVGVVVAAKKWAKHGFGFSRDAPQCAAAPRSPAGIEYVDLLGPDAPIHDTGLFVEHVMARALSAVVHKTGDLPAKTHACVLAALRVLAKRHGAPHIVDGTAHIDVLADRGLMCAMLRELCVPHTHVALPHTTLAPDTAGHVFPAVLKPLSACGTRRSHDMAVVFAAAHVGSMRGVLQAFVPHGSVLFKVYVVGDSVDVQLRPTVELHCGAAPCAPSTGGALPPASASQAMLSDPEGESDGPDDVVHAPQTFCFSTSAMKKTRVVDRSSDEGRAALARLAPHMDAVRSFSARLRASLGGMALFGWDLIIGADDGVLYAIDVNYFPGYDDAPFHAMLAAHLLGVLAA